MDETLLEERVLSKTLTLIRKRGLYPFRNNVDSSRAFGSAVPFIGGATFRHSLLLKSFPLHVSFRPWPMSPSHVV